MLGRPSYLQDAGLWDDGLMTDLEMPSTLAERPTDPELGVPVPFATEYDDGTRSLGELNRRRVTQCALSRICGLCGRSLEWQVAFLGSADDADRNGFVCPPLHRGCAEAAARLYPGLGVPVLGQDAGVHEWALVVTGGFELERPASREGDQRVVFHPNAVTSERRFAP